MRVFPVSLTQPSDGLGATFVEDDGSRDAFLVRQMHALAISIYQAKQRGDRAGVENLLSRFKLLADEYRARGATDMSAADNFVLAVGDWIETSIDAIPAAIAALPRAVGSGIFQAVIPFALLYVGYLYLTSSQRRFF